jgi:hypothetical protein
VFFRIVAQAAVAAHFAFLAFGVLGGFLAWRWPRVLWFQVAGATWLVLVVAAGLPCPLTWAEDRARERAGMAPKPGGFLANHVAGLFYPHGQLRPAMVVAAAVVLTSWIGYARLSRSRTTPPRRPAGSRWRSRARSADPAARP